MTLRFIRTDINLMPLEHSALGGFIFNKRFLKKLFKAGVERKKLCEVSLRSKYISISIQRINFSG